MVFAAETIRRYIHLRFVIRDLAEANLTIDKPGWFDASQAAKATDELTVLAGGSLFNLSFSLRTTQSIDHL